MSDASAAVTDISFASLVALLRERSTVVLAGAGCSTESGIPDYRGPEGRMRSRPPVQYGEFVRTPSARTRYWARSLVGWGRMSTALPNRGHLALARLEREGRLRGIITQNVDGLHQVAGSRRVVELHGSLGWVRCLDCDARITRDELQERLMERNGRWLQALESGPGAAAPTAAPDGDAELQDAALEGFVVPGCDACGGLLKPDVVFFGENVPAECVQSAWRLFEEAEALLIVGSSLHVFSGRRFVYRAVRDRIPIGIVNIGATRADEQAVVRVEGRLGTVLPLLADALADA